MCDRRSPSCQMQIGVARGTYFSQNAELSDIYFLEQSCLFAMDFFVFEKSR